MEDKHGDAEMEQIFVVKVSWSPDSGGRLTEGDIQESIEQMALEIDEEAAVEVEERIGGDI